MGFIRAFVGGLSQTFANQWLDYYQPMKGVPESAALIPAVAIGTDKGVGQNTKGSSHVISNGSKVYSDPDSNLLIFSLFHNLYF